MSISVKMVEKAMADQRRHKRQEQARNNEYARKKRKAEFKKRMEAIMKGEPA